MLSRSVNNTSYKLLKSLKIRKVFACLLLLLFLFGDTFNSDVFAAKKKKKGGNKSSRRSAGSRRRSGSSGKKTKKSNKKSTRHGTTGKGTKKSVSSGKSSRRSAGSKSNRRSAGARNSRRSASVRSGRRSVVGAAARGSVGTSGTGSGISENAPVATHGLESCPIGRVLWQKPGEERNNVLYSLKTLACYYDDNTTELKYFTEANKENMSKPAWINKDDAVFLSCAEGYLKTIKDKKSVCVGVDTVCPLNTTVLEKIGGKYMYADTKNECNAPANSTPFRLTKEQIEAQGFDLRPGKAYYLQCKEGFYSKENTVECGKCKKFYTSDKGSIGELACHPSKNCDAGFEMSDETGECVKKEAQRIIEKKMECKAASKSYDEEKRDCGESCKTGWFVNDKFQCEITAAQLEKDTIADCYKKGQSYDYTYKKCQTCDQENNILKSNGQCIPMTANYCNMTAPCRAGYYGIGCGKCKPCPAGTYTSSSGNLSCTPCLAGTYANGTGNTYCKACAAGSYAKGTGNASCKTCSCKDSNSGIYSSSWYCSSDGLKTRVWGVAGHSSEMVDLNVRRYCSGYAGLEGCDINPSSWSADIKRGYNFKVACKPETGNMYLKYD